MAEHSRSSFAMSILPYILRITWQHTFRYYSKICLAHLHDKAHICAKFHGNRAKTEKVVCNTIFSIILAHKTWAVTMATHLLSLSRNVSCWPTSQHSIRIPWKLAIHWWSSFAMKHLVLCFVHNMPLPWQRTFCLCRNICLAHNRLQTNICTTLKIDQKLWEEFATQDLNPFLPIICHYHGNILSGTVEKCVLHIYNPRHTSVASFMTIGQKFRK